MRQVAVLSARVGTLHGELEVIAHGPSPGGAASYQAVLRLRHGEGAIREELSMSLCFENPSHIAAWLASACPFVVSAAFCTAEMRIGSRMETISTRVAAELFTDLIRQMQNIEERVNEWQSARKLH